MEKDTFYTTTAAETGGADSNAEPNAELQTIVATLSGSIVGPLSRQTPHTLVQSSP